MLDGYQQRSFSAATRTGHIIEHDVYSRGESGPTVIIIQELPGIGPETLDLADRLSEQGYRVVLPHLFGPLGKVSMVGNMVRVFCLRKEFRLFEKNASSPIVDWLKALCRNQLDDQGSTAVGVIGMCLTGNFAISLMADEAVLAGVASQPSMPFGDQNTLHMSAEEIANARTRLDQHGAMMALRFKGDGLCKAEKFKALDAAFNDDRERIKLVELEGKAHSVFTLDFAKHRKVTEPALADVLSYFERQLKTATSKS